MDDIFEELYYQFAYLPEKDTYSERTARWEPFFHDALSDSVDTKSRLVYNAFLADFRGGLRLGLHLELTLPLPEDLQL